MKKTKYFFTNYKTMKLFGKFVLKAFGWENVNPVSPDLKRCVIVIAPHTSNWDFVWGKFIFWGMGIKVKFLIKKEMFFFPLGGIFKGLGALPVDRTKGNSMITAVTSMFKKRDELRILITPEGTRKLVKKWKMGFYYIAKRAEVPIVLGFIDYKLKKVGVLKVFDPSEDMERDLEMIQDYYREINAKFPENFNLSKECRNS